MWVEGEAADRAIALSQRAVRRGFTKQKHANFATEREFKRFLRETGQTVGDLEYRVRLDILSVRLRRAAAGSGSPRSQADRLDRFIRRWTKKWTARTSCLPAFHVDACGSTFT
jgi:hypothetical protein